MEILNRKFTRREVLKYGIRGAVTAATAGVFAASISETERRGITNLRGGVGSVTRPVLETIGEIAPSVIDTTARTVLWTAAEIPASALVSVYDAPIGTRTTEEDIRLIGRAPIDSLLGASITPTVAQEALRWIPANLLPENLAGDWKVNLLQAALFSSAGNSKYTRNPEPPHDVQPEFYPDGKIPLFQTAEAAYFYLLQRRDGKGLLHAVLAHSLNAGIKLLLTKCFYKSSPNSVSRIAEPITEGMVAQFARESVLTRLFRRLK